MPEYPVTDAETGASFPDPESFDGPQPFVEAILAANGDPLGEAKFLGLCRCLFNAFMADEDSPGGEMKAEMISAMTETGMVDADKVNAIVDSLFAKLRDIILPFVGGAVFKWIDRDASKGITKAEVEAVITMMMEGPEAGLGLVFSAIDYDNSGSLSSEELSKFLAEVFQVAAKCAHCIVDTLACAFKEDVVQQAVGQIFAALDANGDGKLDADELSQFKQGLEQMTDELKAVAADDDKPPALEMFLNDAKMMKEFAEKEGEAGADLAKFKEFNMSVIEGRIKFVQDLINSEEVTDAVPPPIYSKIKEFEGPALTAIKAAAESKLDAVSKAAFALIDADGDGKLSKEEILGLGGMFSPDISAEDKFKHAFALVDTDGDGFCDEAEVKVFIGKIFDFAVAMAQAGIDIGASVGSSIGALAIKFLMDKMFGGTEITNEMVVEIIAEVSEEGPEMLLGKLMEEEDDED
jgi:Ca2+-binding EF-hand superfamily protein